MQTTIVFALFCEAFIGGVSSAHGEILRKKSANNFICPTFCRQNWLYSYECRNILVKKFQISHIYVLSCYIGYTYYSKRSPRIAARASFVMATRKDPLIPLKGDFGL